MSLDYRNNIICESNADIMQYLILKLESRRKNLNSYAQTINSINSIETFYLKKKDIFNLFQNLEEELRQASLAIKALMIQNKALSEEKSQIFNIKQNYAKLLNENNYLLKENNNLTQKIRELKSPDKFEKRSKSPFNINKYQNYKFKKNAFEHRDYEKKVKSFKNKANYSSNNVNKTSNIRKKLNNNNNNIHVNESYDDIKELKNVKSIMAEMKKNKLKLKEVVNEHFGKNGFK